MKRGMFALAFVGGLVALAAPAAAFLPVIDPTAIVHAVIMTANQVSQLANEATEITNQVSSLKNETTNLTNLGRYNLLGNLEGEARSIWQSSHAGSPLRMGSNAAAQADVQTQTVDAHITAADNAARTATGALSIGQAQALYLNTIASEDTKANELHAADEEQQQHQQDALTTAIESEAGDGTSIGVK